MERGKIIYVNSFEDLNVHVFTIGYPIEGEAILFIISDKGKPIFTSLTDCYITEECNHIETILSRFQNHAIDIFFWTHPDKDHSVGIKDILNKFDTYKTARIFLPSSFDSENAYNISDDIKSSLKYLYDNYNVSIR